MRARAGMDGAALRLLLGIALGLWGGSLPGARATTPNGASAGALSEELLAEGRIDDAILSFRAALRERPSDLHVIFGLSKALALNGRREEGLTLLEVEWAKERGPLRKQELARRLQVLAHLFLSNVHQQIYFEGVTLLLAQRYADARARFEKVNALEPYQADVLFRLGQVHLLLGDPDTAVESFRQATRFARPSPARQLWLARALDLKGDAFSAREVFGTLPRRGASSLAALWQADFLRRSGKLKQARDRLVWALRVDPQEIRVIRSLVEVEQELLAVLPVRPSGRSHDTKNLRRSAERLEAVLRQGPRTDRVLEDEPATLFFSDSEQAARELALAVLEAMRSRFPPSKGFPTEGRAERAK